MASGLNATTGEDAASQLSTWLNVLDRCEDAAGRGGRTASAEDVEALRLMLEACKADVLSLLTRIEEGEPLQDSETQELLLFLQGEVASLKSRILRARVSGRRAALSQKDRAEVRD